jgi:hypothetical protein
MIYTILYDDNQGQTNTISFDCITNASESFLSSITEHPVESGSPISDHIHHKNTVIDIDGVVSDYNVTSPSVGGSLIEFVDGFIIDTNVFPQSPVEIVRSQLILVRDNKIACTVLIGKSGDNTLAEYKNCALTSLRFSDTASGGEALYASLSFTPIRVAYSSRKQEDKVPAILLQSVTQTVNKDGSSGVTTANGAKPPTIAKPPTADYGVPDAARVTSEASMRRAALLRQAAATVGGN